MKNSMSDDKEWSREVKELSKSQTKDAIVEAQILADAEAIVEPEIVNEKAPYDLHLKFLGKKIADINNTLQNTNEHLSWLSFALKLILGLNALVLFLWFIIFILSFGD